MSTYSWNDALTVAKLYVKNIPTTTIDVSIADQLNAEIWKAGIWRWSLATLTSATSALALVDGQQDYTVGTTTGAGFYRFWRLRITRTDVTPNVARDKDIIHGLTPCLDLQGSIDTIQAMGPIQENTYYISNVQQTVPGIRLERAASVASGTTYQIDGEYQFNPVKITATSSVIVFPDQYFQLAVEGLKYKYYLLGDDPRAMEQRAVYLDQLSVMKRDEDLGDGDGYRFPSDVVGASRAGNPGLFGFY